MMSGRKLSTWDLQQYVVISWLPFRQLCAKPLFLGLWYDDKPDSRIYLGMVLIIAAPHR